MFRLAYMAGSGSTPAPTAIEPHGDDPPFTSDRGSKRGPCGAAGQVFHALFAQLPIAARVHRDVVLTETWNRSAARRNGHPSSTTQRASARQPRGPRKAFGWDIESLRLWNRTLRQAPLHSEVFFMSPNHDDRH
jgi:hypothetical protein